MRVILLNIIHSEISFLSCIGIFPSETEGLSGAYLRAYPFSLNSQQVFSYITDMTDFDWTKINVVKLVNICGRNKRLN